MSLLYQPTPSGRWHTAHDEVDSTREAINDLLDVRVSVKSKAMRRESFRRSSVSRPVATVELMGQPYRIPEPCPKEFYRDLTYLSDEEIIEKYRLLPCDMDRLQALRRLSAASKGSASSTTASR